MDAPNPSVQSARAAVSALNIFTLAWPIMISRSAQVVVGLADAWMVAHLGASALAATTTGAMNSVSLFILPMGTVFIVSSFSSQYFGQGDLEGARRYAFYGLAVAAGTQLLVFAALPFVGTAVAQFQFAPVVAALLHAYPRQLLRRPR
jgi:multidrug resistance protein, MATE family